MLLMRGVEQRQEYVYVKQRAQLNVFLLAQ